MNSEILFRGKTADSNEWVYGYLADGTMICNWYNQDKHSWEVKASTVGQYTGLKDRNGKMIFEGDNIELTSLNIATFGEKTSGLINYQRACFCVVHCDTKELKQSLFSCDLENEIEVVGNIYDNPELEKGGES